MPLPADKWDLVMLPDADLSRIEDLFGRTKGQPYDLMGALGVVFRCGQRGQQWFCSEWCAAALGLPESWRFGPNTLAAVVRCAEKKGGQHAG